MKLPKDDDDLRGDERFEEDHEALFASSNLNREKPNPVINCCATGVAYIQYFWIFRRLECVLTLVLITSVTLALTGVIETYEHSKHSFKNHRFKNIYADISSPLELKLGEIDHWCLDGRDDTCPRCDDPTHPISRAELEGWKNAFVRNIHLSKKFVDRGVQPDVIFLGDSLVEAAVGTLMGVPGEDNTVAAQELDKIKAYYDSHFNKNKSGKYDALMLGIAGDTSPNLFWRLLQNEMRSLTPQVYWLSIGRNDLFKTKCSEEVALIGVIRIIEELVAKNDGATIVINSILPTASKSTLQLDGRGSHNDMWKSIEQVNSRLKNFAQRHHHVIFYDSNEVFVTTKHNNKYIKKDLYADKVHPSFKGYKELAQSQLEFLDALIKKRGEAKSNEKVNSQAQLQTPDDIDEHGDDYYGYLHLFDTTDILGNYHLYQDDDFY